MGKSPKPLTFLVTDDKLAGSEEFVKLKSQGHVVGTWMDLVKGSLLPQEIDAVVGPNVWRMTHGHLKYLDLTILEARKHRYGGKVE